ncbi:MAG: ATP-binding protein [Actinomycetota bacterium]|nr:ATP-binding protein [Actinomycetota bacterium]
MRPEMRGGPAGAPGTSPSRGRLFGKNVLEGVFRAGPDEDLFLGELLVAVDETNARRYVFRVVDVTYGTEHRESGWAERVAGTLLTDDTRGETGLHTLYEQGRRTYRVASCRCLGYLTGAVPARPGAAQETVAGSTPTGFRKPKSLPAQFSRVVAPEPSDFAFLRSRMGDLPFGFLRSGENLVDVEVGISGASLASHVGVFATTGMGKSNLLKVMAAGVMRAQGRYGLLVVDPHGEHRPELARHPWAGDRLRTYAARSLPGTSSLRVGLSELTVDDLRTAYEWSRPQEEALFELERHYSASASASAASADGAGLSWLLAFAQVDDLPGFREVEINGRVALNTLQVLHRRARRIVELPCVAADAHVSVGEAVLRDLREGKVVLVDVSGLGSTEEVLVASFLTRRVLDEWSSLYLDDPETHKRLPVVAIVLEEAQRVLGARKDRESNVFPRVAREGRKFKVGLCAVTQQPKLLDDELLSQFNTFFILGLADEKDRSILRGSSKQDISALGPEIQTLMPGECLLANLEAPFALPAVCTCTTTSSATVRPRPFLAPVLRSTPEPSSTRWR